MSGKGYQHQHGNSAPMTFPTAVAAVHTAQAIAITSALSPEHSTFDPDDLSTASQNAGVSCPVWSFANRRRYLVRIDDLQKQPVQQPTPLGPHSSVHLCVVD